MAAPTLWARCRRCRKRRVSWTLAAEGTAPSGRPSVATTTWYLVPGLPRSVGLGPVSSPPCLARTEQLSTTTSQGATSGPARTMRTSTAWTRRSSATALQSSRRRRKAERKVRPTMARSSRHCTPSRRKNRSASTTLIVGTGGRPVPDGRSSIRSMIPATNAVALDAMLASPCQRHGKRTLGLPDAERLTTNQSSGNQLLEASPAPASRRRDLGGAGRFDPAPNYLPLPSEDHAAVISLPKRNSLRSTQRRCSTVARPAAPVRAQSAHPRRGPGGAARGLDGRVRLHQPDPGRRGQRYSCRPQ